MRGEIQGLRAIAVGLVLLFHVWPDVMPGGYVGVDVFFVISGYLIVGSLAREAEREGRISVLAFYSRRVRRLLPAASLVLVFVLAAMFVWLPPARWDDTLLQVGASSIYAQNWYLAWATVDYLAAENAPSPVQHYWSLSIEEQFYIAWPLVVLVVLWISRRQGVAVRPLIGVALGLVFLGSLAASVTLTASNPGRAYFVTQTRVWELALGGLLAVWCQPIQIGPRLRAVLCLSGLGAILFSGLSYGGVAFPGYAALVPSLGAAAVILAGDVRSGYFRGLDMAPLRYVGDISYSLYLWHWPLIVFFLATGSVIGAWQGVLLIVASVAISHLSYHHVEERFRHPQQPAEVRPLRYGFASILMIVAITSASFLTISGQTPADAKSADATLYPGPAALVDGAQVPEGVPIVPAPTQLMRDRSVVYDSECHQDQEHSEALVCEFGDAEGVTSVAVVGSSHSVNWLPAIDALGRKNGWKVYSVTKSACGFRNSGSETCDTWHDNVLAFLKSTSVDAMFVAENAGESVEETEEELVASRLRRITDLEIPILAVRPTPHLRTRPGDCLPEDIERCVIPRAEAERADPLALSVETLPGLQVIDMNDAICGPHSCSPVVGNLAVFRDEHHLTATYSRALAPFLEKEIVRAFPDLLPVRNNQTTSPAASSHRHRRATIRCGPTGGSDPFTRSYALGVEGDHIVLRRGDWQARSGNFEEWEGRIAKGVVTISGRYREGRNIKPVRLEGSVENGIVVADGKRGPRNCSLTWPLGREQVANSK